MRIAITGANGQLGTEITQALSQHTIFPLNKPEYDVADLQVVDALTGLRPDLVIHTAAMTNVDGCATDPDQAYLVNALGTRNVALACQRVSAEMLYISTNEVFDGAKSSPYLEFDPTHPINVYGMSKHAGESYVRTMLNRYYIVRTSWLFGRAGNNFVAKMISLADQHVQLKVVTDEVGSPAYAKDVAEAIEKLIQTHVYGIYHFANAGFCSRYEFARAIMELSGRTKVSIEPIESGEFVRASKPPPYSPLRNFCGEALGISLRPWQDALADFLTTMGMT